MESLEETVRCLLEITQLFKNDSGFCRFVFESRNPASWTYDSKENENIDCNYLSYDDTHFNAIMNFWSMIDK